MLLSFFSFSLGWSAKKPQHVHAHLFMRDASPWGARGVRPSALRDCFDIRHFRAEFRWGNIVYLKKTVFWQHLVWMVVHSTSFLDSKGHTPHLPPIPPLERMLGLNPQFQGAHPFHSMMGLHAANMNAAMAAAASQANNPSGGPPPPPPISTPSSMPSPGGPRGPRDLSGPPPGPPGPPPHPMNAGLNMWLNMWQHLNK